MPRHDNPPGRSHRAPDASLDETSAALDRDPSSHPDEPRPAAGRATELRGEVIEVRGAHESDDDFALRSDGAAGIAGRPDDGQGDGRGYTRMSVPGPAPDSAAALENALHGQPHGQVYFVLHTYVAAGYELDVAALAREPAGHALGSDIRVRKNGLDPRTGDRHVEEIAFAIESQRPDAGEVIAQHVEALLARGVRRIFTIRGASTGGAARAIGTRAATEPRARTAERKRADIDIDERKRAMPGRSLGKHARRPGPLREWVPAQSAWRTYGDDATIIDASLCQPVPVRALLDAVEADRAVARALIDRRVDVIEEYGNKRFFAGKDEGYRSGSSEGFRAGKDEGYRAGKDEGYRAGKNDGYRAGTNDGYRAGTSDGVREAILLLLRARGIAVDENAYARIAACVEIGILQRWLTRAVYVISAPALFDDA
jgi:hypothetical protein